MLSVDILQWSFTHYRPASEKKYLTRSFPFSITVKKYHSSGNLKFNFLGIFQSLKLRILMEEVPSISLKRNVTSNTLGVYGFNILLCPSLPSCYPLLSVCCLLLSGCYPCYTVGYPCYPAVIIVVLSTGYRNFRQLSPLGLGPWITKYLSTGSNNELRITDRHWGTFPPCWGAFANTTRRVFCPSLLCELHV